MIISFFITERWTEREVMYVSYVGKLFLRMLKALILPLIVPSLVAAVGSLDMSISGKVNGNIFTNSKILSTVISFSPFATLYSSFKKSNVGYYTIY